MFKKDAWFGDPRYRQLYSQCLAETPLARDVPRGKPLVPPEIFIPQNFDQLYNARGRLQKNELMLVRDPHLQAWYLDVNKFFNSVQQSSPDQFHPFKSNIALDLDQHRVSLQRNDYHYQIPDDTVHSLLWYKKRVSRQERAQVLSRFLFMDDLGPGDFMILRNSPYRKSVPEYAHDHVYTRIKPGSLGVFIPIPSQFEIY